MLPGPGRKINSLMKDTFLKKMTEASGERLAMGKERSFK